jgi:hypothetical protein
MKLFIIAAFAVVFLGVYAKEESKKEKEIEEAKKEKELSHKHLEQVKSDIEKAKLEKIHKRAVRPLIIQQIVRLKERIIVDKKNHPKEYSADIAKGIYKIENGQRSRISYSHVVIQPRQVKSASFPGSFAQQREGDEVDPVVGAFVLLFVILVFVLLMVGAYLIEKRDQKKKNDAEYAKILKLPTSEDMSHQAPLAPSSRDIIA